MPVHWALLLLLGPQAAITVSSSGEATGRTKAALCVSQEMLGPRHTMAFAQAGCHPFLNLEIGLLGYRNPTNTAIKREAWPQAQKPPNFVEKEKHSVEKATEQNLQLLL